MTLWIVAPLVVGRHCMCSESRVKPVCLLQETDAVTAAIKELGQQFPSLLEPLIFERDLFMVHRLRTVPK